jgi:hypothetical protein
MNANTLTQNLAARVASICFTFLLTSFSSVAQPVIAYPDLQVVTPPSLISIGNPTPSTREFRFSHITWNAGAGPLEIRPNYNATTNQSQSYQRLYTRNASGGLTFVKDVPIAIPMYWVPPSDYRFAMSGFGLYSDVNGSIGTLIAPSPKVNFCMTADVAVNLKLPFAPSSTAYSPGDCTDPNGILGLSIGWGDQYDYTDPGENIDITSLPDGIYWLRSVADPYHVFQESKTNNNATDTQVQITGTTVKVLQQLQPDSTPPTVTITSPTGGSSVSGSVVLTATAIPVAGTSIRAQGVQFLVDGQPIGGNVTANPPQYSLTWNASPGSHLITAQATASNGFIGTAPLISVSVPTQIGSLVTDQTVNAAGVGTVTTQAFSTSVSNELLLAFVGSDGPVPSQSQSITVSGGSLSWTLVARANSQSGDAEIWSATVPSPSNLTVTSVPTASGYSQSLTVLALYGTSGTASVGAHATAGSPHGGVAPSVNLTTTAPDSWVLGVGSDYDNAIAPTLGSNQKLLNQQLFGAAGVTFWVQATTGVIPSANTPVTLNDTAPIGDQWNFSSVEVVAAGSQPPPPDTTPPVVNIVTPVAGTVSGTVTVSANATDNVALRASNPVVFSLNSTVLPGQVTANGSLFSTSWDTTTSANGPQVLSATATDTSGNTSAATVNVTVSNPPPTTTCFIVDSTTSAYGHSSVTTSPFSDALPGELLVAFAGSDGPNSSGSQTVTVSGGGLTWTLVKRANAQAGTAEVWTSTAPSTARLTNARITAKQSRTGYDLSLYVIAVQGTGGIGASAAQSAGNGAPSVTLTTTKAGSLIYGVGNDWDNAVARVIGINQIMDNQRLDTGTGDTYWIQNQTYPPLIPAGASITLNDTAPTNDRWNFVSVEIIADDN